MTERFKFRMWNKHINEYCDIQNLFILPTGETGYFITDGSYPHQRKFMHQEDMIIEMCTGLKDKNGNLIYEGDLLTDGKDIGTVIWTGTGWGCTDFLFKKKPETLEIIGNIHEQKEQQ